MTARTMWPTLPQILNDRLSNLVLDWILLDSTTLGTLHTERFATPVEIIQSKSCYFAASQPVKRKKQENGCGAQFIRSRSPRRPYESSDLNPRWPFGAIFIFWNSRTTNAQRNTGNTPTPDFRITKEGSKCLTLGC